MSLEPSTITVNAPSARPSQSAFSQWFDVLGSMRFAISSLSILAIASIIGTLLKQREPFVNYVNQFGPFWADLFQAANIYEVYNAWWFLLVLTFLVCSTSLCVFRNSPKMVRDMRAWREKIRSNSLRSFHHHGEAQMQAPIEQVITDQQAALQRIGYKVKQDVRADGVMLAARRGGSSRLGYIFAHAGIVVVCIGGLLDSELPIKTVIKWMERKPLPVEFVSGDPPASSVLPVNNPSFRANLFVPEGGLSSAALVTTTGGTMVQELPFTVQLKHFNIEYYSTGMPKLFASEVVVTDRVTGKKREATIKVNEPLIEQGIAIYQSSFDDGGSELTLRAMALGGNAKPIDIKAVVGSSTDLKRANGETYKLELTGFRAINVENTTAVDAPTSDDKKFKESVATVLSPSANNRSKDLHNVGPSVQYRLRDSQGQAREFNVYQLPVVIEGQPMFLAGTRSSVNDQLTYLRIPADEKGSLDEFVRIRAALANPDLVKTAALNFATQSAPRKADSTEPDPAVVSNLAVSAERALSTFAKGGLTEVATFIDKNIPKAEQEKASEMFMRVLASGLWELWRAARAQDNVKAPEWNEANSRFIQSMQVALSDSFIFDAPLILHLQDYKEVKASVFQVTRSPGKNIVYLGSLSLVLGIFAMLYIRERRVWCWIAKAGQDTCNVLFAMTATRKTLLLDEDFARLKHSLQDRHEHYRTKQQPQA